jgi:hypothetical protein
MTDFVVWSLVVEGVAVAKEKVDLPAAAVAELKADEAAVSLVTAFSRTASMICTTPFEAIMSLCRMRAVMLPEDT